MARLVKTSNLKEGQLFMKWMESRLIRNNKNVLGAELGPTGSGKSYRDLRKAELWYLYHFKEKFPTENICFGVSKVIKLLSEGKLRRGEIIIFEEAGANLGSLDFQNKVSKMFTYVLQSFRSMNIAIFFNLPYLSMLNKQARMLMHYSFESSGIDFERGINKCKPFFHQVNQGTGKIYKKYMRAKVNGKTQKIKRFNFKEPSKYLTDAYEAKKAAYLTDMTDDYVKELDRIEAEKNKRLDRPQLSPNEIKLYPFFCKDMRLVDIEKETGFDNGYLSRVRKNIRKKGYDFKNDENA